jgi:hypothetical protein
MKQCMGRLGYSVRRYMMSEDAFNRLVGILNLTSGWNQEQEPKAWHWKYPQGNPPAGCSRSNCRLSTRRLDCHCHCCVEGVEITIVDWIEVGMLQKNHRVFLRCFVLRCYRRLITTSRMQWSHCHCCWRSGRLSFAMVRPFGVAVGVAKRKVIENN